MACFRTNKHCLGWERIENCWTCDAETIKIVRQKKVPLMKTCFELLRMLKLVVQSSHLHNREGVNENIQPSSKINPEKKVAKLYNNA